MTYLVCRMFCIEVLVSEVGMDVLGWLNPVKLSRVFWICPDCNRERPNHDNYISRSKRYHSEKTTQIRYQDLSLWSGIRGLIQVLTTWFIISNLPIKHIIMYNVTLMSWKSYSVNKISSCKDLVNATCLKLNEALFYFAIVKWKRLTNFDKN